MSTQSSFGKEAILFSISSVLLPHLHSDLYLFVVVWVAVHRIYILYIPTTHTQSVTFSVSIESENTS